MDTFLGMLVFMGGFMAIIVGVNYAIRWTNRKIGGGPAPDALADMEQRVAQLEERLDTTERLLSDVRAQQLPPRR
jgi:hypothetical protein